MIFHYENYLNEKARAGSAMDVTALQTLFTDRLGLPEPRVLQDLDRDGTLAHLEQLQAEDMADVDVVFVVNQNLGIRKKFAILWLRPSKILWELLR